MCKSNQFQSNFFTGYFLVGSLDGNVKDKVAITGLATLAELIDGQLAQQLNPNVNTLKVSDMRRLIHMWQAKSFGQKWRKIKASTTQYGKCFEDLHILTQCQTYDFNIL